MLNHMHKFLILAGTVVVIGGIAVLASVATKGGWVTAPTPAPEQWVCTADAMQCPDGSYVGRTGPNCEFVCPAASATSSTVTVALGGTATGLTVSVNPRVLVSDSRCPADVQCVWAGTVEVRAAVSTQVAHGEHVFKLGEPRVFGDFVVTLADVTPAVTKAGVDIPDSSYRFTFEIRNK